MACRQFQGLWQRQSVEQSAMSRSEQGVPANEGLQRIALGAPAVSLATLRGTGAIETTCTKRMKFSAHTPVVVSFLPPGR